MNLTIDIIEASDAKKIWITDISTGYGISGAIPVTGITSIIITFLYQDPISLDYSDCITIDKVISLTGLNFTSQDEMNIEIVPTDIEPGWLVFPEGVYHIKYSIGGSGGTLPANNSTYYFSEVLFAQTQSYYDNLLLKIAREMQSNVEENYLLWYTFEFGVKLDAFKSTIAIGNFSIIRDTLKYLQDNQTKYPNSNDTRRYYKTPFRN